MSFSVFRELERNGEGVKLTVSRPVLVWNGVRDDLRTDAVPWHFSQNGTENGRYSLLRFPCLTLRNASLIRGSSTGRSAIRIRGFPEVSTLPWFTYPLKRVNTISGRMQRYSTAGERVPIFRPSRLLKISATSFFDSKSSLARLRINSGSTFASKISWVSCVT